MVRSDLGDVDPWVPFLAELRQAQSGDPVEVWLLDPAGERQATEPKHPAAGGVASIEAGPRLRRPAESHPILVRRRSRSDPDANPAAPGGSGDAVRFCADGEGRTPHA